ncbi:MAG: YfhO family protein [Bacteroidota bacterium]
MNFKKFIPHIAAVVIFAVITLIYFKPMLSGKELKQGDIDRHKGMSKEIVDYRTTKKAEPLWTNSMFGGMPAYLISTLYPNNFIGKLDNAFKLFIPLPAGYVFLYFLGFFILLLCLDVDPWLSIIGAVAYGLSSYFLIILEAGHNSKANAIGYLPALLGGFILLFKGKHWLGFALITLFTCMEINCNHFQITYYGYILIAVVSIGYLFQLIKAKKNSVIIYALVFGLFGTIIGILPNASMILTTMEYGKYSTRGKTELTIDADLKSNKNNTTSGLDKNYATQWSYGIGETFTFLIPDFKGGASSAIGTAYPDALKKISSDYRDAVANSNAYFGDQPFTSGPVYIGAILIFLCFLGMFIVKNPIKWPLFLATLLTIALSWGSNFMGLTNFFMDFVPGYNKFRAVSMILVVAELTLPLLALLTLNELIKYKDINELIQLRLIKKTVKLKTLLFVSVGVIGGICAIGYIAPSAINTFSAHNEAEIMISQYVQGGNPESQVRPYVTDLMPQLEKARMEIFKSDAIRSLVFILLAFGAIYFYLTGKLKRKMLYAAIGIFVLIDLWSVGTRYLNDKSFITKQENQQNLQAKSAADDEILKDKTLGYRVLNLTLNTFNDAQTSYYHKSIGGYHGAKLKRYQELIDFQLMPNNGGGEIGFFRQNAGKAFASDSAINALMGQLNVINMLNTKYFIIPGGGEQRTEIPLENKQANGPAWFVKELKFVNSADSEIVLVGKLNTKTTAVVNEKFKGELGLKNNYSGEGTIKLSSYEPNELTYECNSKSDNFIVFSEIYYPKGWNAYINGTIVPHVQVNYVLRGLPIKAGQSTIVFKFEPTAYYTGNTYALIGSILVLIVIGLALFMHKKNSVIVS